MVVALWIIASVVVGFLGRHRKFGFWGFFLASLILSPPIILLVLILTQYPRPVLSK